jgi:hypothetical protein
MLGPQPVVVLGGSETFKVIGGGSLKRIHNSGSKGVSGGDGSAMP